MQPVPHRIPILIATLLAALCLPASALRGPSQGQQAGAGWEIRDLVNTPPPPTPPPPSESGEGETGSTEDAPAPVEPFNPNWKPAQVPGVFAADANPSLFGGTAKQYQLRFTAPPKASGFTWAFRFEGSHRRTTAFLNGRRIGVSIDPYTPFELPAKGLRAGTVNELVVTVDSRKDPKLPEAWWNYGGIVRPVSLVPKGRVGIKDIGLLSDVTCKGLATRCKAGRQAGRDPVQAAQGAPALQDHDADRRKGKKRRRVVTRVKVPLPQPKLVVKLRSPQGRLTRKAFKLQGLRSARQRLKDLEVPVPAPEAVVARQPTALLGLARAWSTRAAPSRSTARRSACAR